MSGRRLRICYVVPGHVLLSTQGPSRNVLSLAKALAAHAEVTVAFRGNVDSILPGGIRVIEIEPGYARGRTFVDDSATRGLGLREFINYAKRLRDFSQKELKRFDIVLEKSWLLSGFVLACCRAQGRPGIAIENLVPSTGQAARGNPLKRLRLAVGGALAGSFLRRTPIVIAETSYLKQALCRVWRLAPERVEVVPLGIDRRLFHPRDQKEARRSLSLAADTTLLTYVGILDGTHDIQPLIEALARHGRAGLALHVVGEGPQRAEYQERARALKAPVVFHGRVAHDRVPLHLAAADLCLAPYDPRAFANGELGYSSMKVPEYLASGRAVATVPSGRMRDLVTDGVNGFLLDNTAKDWQALLERLPDRPALARMGAAAAAVHLPDWDETARAYLALAQRVLAEAEGGVKR